MLVSALLNQCRSKPPFGLETFQSGVLIIVARGKAGGTIPSEFHSCTVVGADLDQHFNNHHCKLQGGQLCRSRGLALPAHIRTQEGKKRRDGGFFVICMVCFPTMVLEMIHLYVTQIREKVVLMLRSCAGVFSQMHVQTCVHVLDSMGLCVHTRLNCDAASLSNSENHSGWKKPFRLLTPTVNPALPYP